MTPRTVSAEWLEAHATQVELPGPEGGWAVAVINGRLFRARVGAVPVEATEPGCTCGGMAACQQCQDRDAAVAEQVGAVVDKAELATEDMWRAARRRRAEPVEES